MTWAGRAVVVDGTLYPSIRAAARGLYVSEYALGKALKRGSAEMCGMSVRYADEPPEAAAERTAPRAGKMRPVLVDGELHASARDAARSIGCSESGVAKAIRRNGIIKGRRVGYADDR